MRKSVFPVKLGYVGKLDLTEKYLVIIEISVPRRRNGGCSEEFTCAEVIALGSFFYRDFDCFSHTLPPSIDKLNLLLTYLCSFFLFL